MIGRKALVIITAKVISSLLGFIALFFMTRYLGPGVYGTIAWTIALMASVNSIADLGFSAAHVKRISEGKDLGQCVSTFAFVRVILTVAMAVVTIAGLIIYTVLLDKPLVDTSVNIVLIFLLYYVFYDLSGIAISTFDARIESVLSQVSLIMDIAIRLPLVILVSINRMDAFDLALAYLIGSLATLSVSMYFLLRKGVRWGRPVLLDSYKKFAYPVVAVIIIGALTTNIDKVAIGFFLTTTQVGYYGAAQSVLLMVSSIGGAATTIFFPAFSKLHTEGNLKEIKRKTWQAERYLSLICVPMLLLFMVFPSEAANILLGYKFKDADVAIQILSFSTLVILMNQPYAIQLYSANRPRLFALIELCHLVTLIGLLVVFVPTSVLGIEMLDLSYSGAAMANFISAMVTVLISRYFVKKVTNVPSNPRIGFHVIGASLTAGVLFLISRVLPISHWYDLMLFGSLSLGFYVAALWALREFDRSDVRYLMDVVNPKKMKNYMVDELKGK